MATSQTTGIKNAVTKNGLVKEKVSVQAHVRPTWKRPENVTNKRNVERKTSTSVSTKNASASRQKSTTKQQARDKKTGRFMKK